MDSQAERWKMVESLKGMVNAAVRGRRGVASRVPGWTTEDSEDLTQDINLMLWKYSENFDPSRGVKWVSYAFPIIDRAAKNAVTSKLNRPEVQAEFDDFDHQPSPESAPDLDEPDTADALHGAVQHQLARGILDKIPAGYRRLVERVVFERLTAEQIAEQDGYPVKSVRANIKGALRWMHSHGLAAMLTADQVRHATAPARPMDNEKNRKARKAKAAAAPRGFVGRLRKQLAGLSTHPDFAARLADLDPDAAAVLALIREGSVATTRGVAELLGLSPKVVRYHLIKAMTALCASLVPPVAYNSSCDSFSLAA